MKKTMPLTQKKSANSKNLGGINQSRLRSLLMVQVKILFPGLLLLISSSTFSAVYYTSAMPWNGPNHTEYGSSVGELCQLYYSYLPGSSTYYEFRNTTIELDRPRVYYCYYDKRPKTPKSNGDEWEWELDKRGAVIENTTTECPNNNTIQLYEWTDGICHSEPELKLDYKQPTNTASCTNPIAGDPIIVATGNSFQTEADSQSQNLFGLSFIRYYSSSSNTIDNGIGKKWFHRYYSELIVDGDTDVHISRRNGQAFTFNYDGSSWEGNLDLSNTLVELRDTNNIRTGWEHHDSSDNVETYNSAGQLLSITNRAGQNQSFAYDIDVANGGDDDNYTLDNVTGFGGEQMLFAYDSEQRIITMTNPEGNEYAYSYDAQGNLANVTYPDNTPLDNTDNPTRTYHYENVDFPSHLTGLTDETGSRVTWAFDAEGRAISSELDGGVDKSTLDFSVADQVKVTNPLGKDTTYHFTTLHGVKKVTQVEGHATASCAGANQNYTYDLNGYLASKTDWQGNVTTYIHDARGLETSRTEASGTLQERTITTQWHPDFRLPTKITAPGQVTDFVYDTQKRLTSQTTNTLQQ